MKFVHLFLNYAALKSTKYFQQSTIVWMPILKIYAEQVSVLISECLWCKQSVYLRTNENILNFNNVSNFEICLENFLNFGQK